MSTPPAPDFYDTGESLPETLPESPFPLFRSWFDEALASRDQPNPDNMALATVGAGGRPSCRIVLCRGIVEDPGRIVFYTNYSGRKGRELEADPVCAATFHWDHAERQVRLEGEVVRSPSEESDAYFARRRWESRVGAWASDQSEPIGSRQAMLDKVRDQIVSMDLDLSAIMDGQDPEIPRPPHWGGYRLYPRAMELWCAGVGRVHDRAVWTRELTRSGDSIEVGPWSATRLQP